ncbi:hypothetical protein AAY473_010361 [Plecturocebus cupreus]
MGRAALICLALTGVLAGVVSSLSLALAPVKCILALSPGLECSGVISAQCNLCLLVQAILLPQPLKTSHLYYNINIRREEEKLAVVRASRITSVNITDLFKANMAGGGAPRSPREASNRMQLPVNETHRARGLHDSKQDARFVSVGPIGH